MPFSQIIGHSKQLQTLRLSIENKRLHHAYLFTGPQGVGKRTIALCLAKAIHCGEMNGDFCGQCVSCARIEDGNHPDVRVIEPLVGKKEISIQQIRETEKNLRFRSFSGRRKVAVWDPATLMNLPAQNALLKTLEEPPQDSLLILIAPNAGGLLPTLRSRCLCLAFGPLQPDLLSSFLVSRRGMKQEDAEVVAAISMGSLGVAVQIDSAELQERRRIWIERLSSLKPGDYRAALDAAEALADDREECLKFLAWAESWYRDLLVHAVTRESRDVINLDFIPRIERESAHGKLEHRLSSMIHTAKAAARIQRNLNRRMVLEDLLFNIVAER
jgi:DNA polymerase-3 subunit delta'